MAHIAAIDAGTSYHYEALRGERYRGYFSELFYLPQLGTADFRAHDAIIFTCRSNPDLLAQHRTKIEAYLEAGGTVVAMGETRPEQWLPGIDFQSAAVNYWWWLEKDADSGLRQATPTHSLFDWLSIREMTWHHHGRFTPPPGAISLVNHVNGGSIFYDDFVTTRGRMIVTSLDPFYHHGSHFMPMSTRFLDGFLPWLHSEFNERETAPRALETVRRR